MKSSPWLAVGLLSAACLTSTLPSNAQTMHRTSATISRIGSRTAGQGVMLPGTAFPQMDTLQRTNPLGLAPGQTRQLGVGTVMALRRTTLTVRFMSGTTGFITVSPRTLQLSRLRPGSRLTAILRADGTVLILPVPRGMSTRTFTRVPK